jgi:hypothetical protein
MSGNPSISSIVLDDKTGIFTLKWVNPGANNIARYRVDFIPLGSSPQPQAFYIIVTTLDSLKLELPYYLFFQTSGSWKVKVQAQVKGLGDGVYSGLFDSGNWNFGPDVTESATARKLIQTSPSWPTDLSNSFNNDKGIISVGWNPPESNGGGDIVRYDVYLISNYTGISPAPATERKIVKASVYPSPPTYFTGTVTSSGDLVIDQMISGSPIANGMLIKDISSSATEKKLSTASAIEFSTESKYDGAGGVGTYKLVNYDDTLGGPGKITMMGTNIGQITPTSIEIDSGFENDTIYQTVVIPYNSKTSPQFVIFKANITGHDIKNISFIESTFLGTTTLPDFSIDKVLIGSGIMTGTRIMRNTIDNTNNAVTLAQNLSERVFVIGPNVQTCEACKELLIPKMGVPSPPLNVKSEYDPNSGKAIISWIPSLKTGGQKIRKYIVETTNDSQSRPLIKDKDVANKDIIVAYAHIKADISGNKLTIKNATPSSQPVYKHISTSSPLTMWDGKLKVGMVISGGGIIEGTEILSIMDNTADEGNVGTRYILSVEQPSSLNYISNIDIYGAFEKTTLGGSGGAWNTTSSNNPPKDFITYPIRPLSWPETSLADINRFTYGQAYRITVKAGNNGNISTQSLPTPLFTPVLTPNAPTDCTVYASQFGISVSWIPPQFNGGTEITEYIVTPYDREGNALSNQSKTIKSSSSNNCVINYLENWKAYTFKVVAVNSVGKSPPSSNTKEILYYYAPKKPASVQAVQKDQDSTIYISWASDSSNYNADQSKPEELYWTIKAVPLEANNNNQVLTQTISDRDARSNSITLAANTAVLAGTVTTPEYDAILATSGLIGTAASTIVKTAVDAQANGEEDLVIIKNAVVDTVNKFITNPVAYRAANEIATAAEVAVTAVPTDPTAYDVSLATALVAKKATENVYLFFQNTTYVIGLGSYEDNNAMLASSTAAAKASMDAVTFRSKRPQFFDNTTQAAIRSAYTSGLTALGSARTALTSARNAFLSSGGSDAITAADTAATAASAAGTAALTLRSTIPASFISDVQYLYNTGINKLSEARTALTTALTDIIRLGGSVPAATAVAAAVTATTAVINNPPTLTASNYKTECDKVADTLNKAETALNDTSNVLRNTFALSIAANSATVAIAAANSSNFLQEGQLTQSNYIAAWNRLDVGLENAAKALRVAAFAFAAFATSVSAASAYAASVAAAAYTGSRAAVDLSNYNSGDSSNIIRDAVGTAFAALGVPSTKANRAKAAGNSSGLRVISAELNAIQNNSAKNASVDAYRVLVKYITDKAIAVRPEYTHFDSLITKYVDIAADNTTSLVSSVTAATNAIVAAIAEMATNIISVSNSVEDYNFEPVNSGKTLQEAYAEAQLQLTNIKSPLQEAATYSDKAVIAATAGFAAAAAVTALGDAPVTGFSSNLDAKNAAVTKFTTARDALNTAINALTAAKTNFTALTAVSAAFDTALNSAQGAYSSTSNTVGNFVEADFITKWGTIKLALAAAGLALRTSVGSNFVTFTGPEPLNVLEPPTDKVLIAITAITKVSAGSFGTVSDKANMFKDFMDVIDAIVQLDTIKKNGTNDSIFKDNSKFVAAYSTFLTANFNREDTLKKCRTYAKLVSREVLLDASSKAANPLNYDIRNLSNLEISFTEVSNSFKNMRILNDGIGERSLDGDFQVIFTTTLKGTTAVATKAALAAENAFIAAEEAFMDAFANPDANSIAEARVAAAYADAYKAYSDYADFTKLSKNIFPPSSTGDLYTIIAKSNTNAEHTVKNLYKKSYVTAKEVVNNAFSVATLASGSSVPDSTAAAAALSFAIRTWSSVFSRKPPSDFSTDYDLTKLFPTSTAETIAIVATFADIAKTASTTALTISNNAAIAESDAARALATATAAADATPAAAAAAAAAEALNAASKASNDVSIISRALQDVKNAATAAATSSVSISITVQAAKTALQAAYAALTSAAGTLTLIGNTAAATAASIAASNAASVAISTILPDLKDGLVIAAAALRSVYDPLISAATIAANISITGPDIINDAQMALIPLSNIEGVQSAISDLTNKLADDKVSSIGIKLNLVILTKTTLTDFINNEGTLPVFINAADYLANAYMIMRDVLVNVAEAFSAAAAAKATQDALGPLAAAAAATNASKIASIIAAKSADISQEIASKSVEICNTQSIIDIKDATSAAAEAAEAAAAAAAAEAAAGELINTQSRLAALDAKFAADEAKTATTEATKAATAAIALSAAANAANAVGTFRIKRPTVFDSSVTIVDYNSGIAALTNAKNVLTDIIPKLISFKQTNGDAADLASTVATTARDSAVTVLNSSTLTVTNFESKWTIVGSTLDTTVNALRNVAFAMFSTTASSSTYTPNTDSVALAGFVNENITIAFAAANAAKGQVTKAAVAASKGIASAASVASDNAATANQRAVTAAAAAGASPAIKSAAATTKAAASDAVIAAAAARKAALSSPSDVSAAAEALHTAYEAVKAAARSAARAENKGESSEEESIKTFLFPTFTATTSAVASASSAASQAMLAYHVVSIAAADAAVSAPAFFVAAKNLAENTKADAIIAPSVAASYARAALKTAYESLDIKNSFVQTKDKLYNAKGKVDVAAKSVAAAEVIALSKTKIDAAAKAAYRAAAPDIVPTAVLAAAAANGIIEVVSEATEAAASIIASEVGFVRTVYLANSLTNDLKSIRVFDKDSPALKAVFTNLYNAQTATVIVGQDTTDIDGQDTTDIDGQDTTDIDGQETTTPMQQSYISIAAAVYAIAETMYYGDQYEIAETAFDEAVTILFRFTSDIPVRQSDFVKAVAALSRAANAAEKYYENNINIDTNTDIKPDIYSTGAIFTSAVLSVMVAAAAAASELVILLNAYNSVYNPAPRTSRTILYASRSYSEIPTAATIILAASTSYNVASVAVKIAALANRLYNSNSAKVLPVLLSNSYNIYNLALRIKKAAEATKTAAESAASNPVAASANAAAAAAVFTSTAAANAAFLNATFVAADRPDDNLIDAYITALRKKAIEVTMAASSNTAGAVLSNTSALTNANVVVQSISLIKSTLDSLQPPNHTTITNLITQIKNMIVDTELSVQAVLDGVKDFIDKIRAQSALSFWAANSQADKDEAFAAYRNFISASIATEYIDSKAIGNTVTEVLNNIANAASEAKINSEKETIINISRRVPSNLTITKNWYNTTTLSISAAKEAVDNVLAACYAAKNGGRSSDALKAATKSIKTAANDTESVALEAAIAANEKANKAIDDQNAAARVTSESLIDLKDYSINAAAATSSVANLATVLIIEVDKTNSLDPSFITGVTNINNYASVASEYSALIKEWCNMYDNYGRGYKFTDLTLGKSYKFAVFATNIRGTSEEGYSNIVRPVRLPSQPYSVIALAGKLKASVSWTAPTQDGGSPIIGYYIYCYKLLLWESEPALENSKPHNVPANVFSYTVSNLTAGFEYVFRISAYTALGVSATTQSIAVTPYDVPGPVRNVVGHPKNRHAVVKWDKPLTDRGSKVINYKISISPDGDGEIIDIDISGCKAVIGPLRNKVNYNISVAAENIAGEGIPTTTSEPVKPDELSICESRTQKYVPAYIPIIASVDGPNIPLTGIQPGNVSGPRLYAKSGKYISIFTKSNYTTFAFAIPVPSLAGNANAVSWPTYDSINNDLINNRIYNTNASFNKITGDTSVVFPENTPSRTYELEMTDVQGNTIKYTESDPESLLIRGKRIEETHNGVSSKACKFSWNYAVSIKVTKFPF